MARILLVDDEPAIVLAVQDELIFEGFEVEMAADGLSALDKARAFHPDVVLLDVMLPGINGFEVCQRLRSDMPDVWIIMLTIREHEADRVRGLESGADDYVTKPFSLRELVARIHVGLRRLEGSSNHSVYAFGNIKVDLAAHQVFKHGEEVSLTPTEFGMLEQLVRHTGELVSRDVFLDAVWGEEVVVVPRVVDTHMSALRRKLEDNPDHPTYLHSVRGSGYRLDPTPTES
jgi:DNA-binding response OmpR family regulator